MKKITTVGSTNASSAGSKGKFAKKSINSIFNTDKTMNQGESLLHKKIRTVGNPTHNGAGSKGLFYPTETNRPFMYEKLLEIANESNYSIGRDF